MFLGRLTDRCSHLGHASELTRHARGQTQVIRRMFEPAEVRPAIQLEKRVRMDDRHQRIARAENAEAPQNGPHRRALMTVLLKLKRFVRVHFGDLHVVVSLREFRDFECIEFLRLQNDLRVVEHV